MGSRLPILFFLPLLVFAQDSISLVNAANFRTTVAPGSLATVFGTSLANETLQAAPDAEGRLPEELGGVSVEIDGTRAGLLFVSPDQVNLVIPPAARTGTLDVVVVGPQRAVRGSATVRLVAPAVFTTDGSGAGSAAILNAVTFAAPPFLVETAEISGTDQRTRLAVYATGFRFAGNPDRDPEKVNVAEDVRADLRTEAGQTLRLAVEYAGPAPGFPGLDQINVVLPPEADGAGEVILVLNGDGSEAPTVSTEIAALPEDAIGVADVRFSPAQVDGGQTATATVILNAPARRVNLSVVVESQDPSVLQAPTLASVPAGQTSVQFEVRTQPIVTTRDIRLTATAGGGTAATTLRVRSANQVSLASLQLSAPSAAPGSSVTGRVSLNRPAPAEGAAISLSSNQTPISVPASVDIGFGQTSATFPVNVDAAASAGTAVIRAAYLDDAFEQRLEVRSPLTISLDKKQVVGGTSVSGAVRIAGVASTTGVAVQLQSSNLTRARVPASVTIPSGSSTSSFEVQTQPVNSNETVTITAQSGTQTASADLELEAETFGIDKLTIEPASVTGGQTAILSITIRTPVAIPGLVTFVSDNFAVARPPITLLLPRGQTTARVNVRTSRVITPTTVEIRATYSGVSRSVKLGVN